MPLFLYLHVKRKNFFFWNPGPASFVAVFLLLLFTFSGVTGPQPAQALEKMSVTPLIPWPHEQSDLSPDPAVKFGRLDNGFRYVLMENDVPKNRVSAHIDVNVGSAHEKDHEQGMAHFLEHMAFCGSTNFKPGELIPYFQSMGMQFGNDANARTGFYNTVFDLLLPGGKQEHLDKGLLVLKDFASGALLLPEEVERERKVVLAEMRTRDSSAYRTFKATLNFELPGTRIAARMPIGKEEIIANMDRSTIRNFYNTWYSPQNMTLVMVGDFDSDEAENLIKKYFAQMKPQAEPGIKPDFGDFVHEGIKTFYHDEKEEGATAVTIEVGRKIDPVTDSFSFKKERLIQHMADRIIQYRLDDLVRKADTPFSSAKTHSGIYYNEVYFAEISADCRPENWESTLSILEQVIRQAVTFGFTAAEIERVKKEMLSQYENSVKNMSTRQSERLARSIISNLDDNMVFQSPAQARELFSPVIAGLTAKELAASMKQTWSPDHRLVLVTGNAGLKETGRNPEELIRNAYNKSATEAVLPLEESEAVVFPYLPAAGKKAVVTAKQHSPESGIVQFDFENGLRLNLKKTEFKANEVLINLSFGSGRSSEPENRPGLAELSEDVLNESGLGRLTVQEVERALAGKETGISFHVAEDRFGFQVNTVPDEIDLSFELLRAHILDPAYRQDAYELVAKRQNQHYQMLNHTTEGAVDLHGSRFFAGGDLRFGLPSQEQFNRLRLSDVKSWIDPVLSGSPLEVSVAGNFDPEAVLEAVSRSLGTLPKRDEHKTEKDERPGPSFPSGKTRNVSVDTKISKALVIVAYPTDDTWDVHQTRRLSVLAEILTDRIRTEIREKLGAAYSPYVSNQSSRAYEGYGKLQAVIQTDPEKVDMVVTEVKKIAADLAKPGAITPQDLKSAIDPTLTMIKDMRQENGYWLRSVLVGSKKHPQQISWSSNIIDDFAAISAEELSRLAGRFLDNGKAAVFIAAPRSE